MVLQFLRGKSPVAETKTSGAAPVIAFHGVGRPAWSARDVVSLTRTGFSQNPVGFRCVKMIAEAAAAVPALLSDKDRRYMEHPLLSLLARPNAAQGLADLLESFYGQLLLSGDGYFEAAGTSADGGPAEL